MITKTRISASIECTVSGITYSGEVSTSSRKVEQGQLYAKSKEVVDGQEVDVVAGEISIHTGNGGQMMMPNAQMATLPTSRLLHIRESKEGVMASLSEGVNTILAELDAQLSATGTFENPTI